jgi:hypothetical protein
LLSCKRGFFLSYLNSIKMKVKLLTATCCLLAAAGVFAAHGSSGDLPTAGDSCPIFSPASAAQPTDGASAGSGDRYVYLTCGLAGAGRSAAAVKPDDSGLPDSSDSLKKSAAANGHSAENTSSGRDGAPDSFPNKMRMLIFFQALILLPAIFAEALRAAA